MRMVGDHRVRNPDSKKAKRFVGRLDQTLLRRLVEPRKRRLYRFGKLTHQIGSFTMYQPNIAQVMPIFSRGWRLAAAAPSRLLPTLGRKRDNGHRSAAS